MTPGAKAKFRVAICGGGIGGLTLACVLEKYSQDVQVDIYEAAEKFSEIGAGISVWRRTWSIMKTLGFDTSLSDMAITPPKDETRVAFIFRKSDQEKGETFWPMMVPYGSITLHRADMLKVLTDNISASIPHFRKRLVRYSRNASSSDPVTLHFQDGTTAEADVLVGCDGFRSATRATMFRNGSLAKFVEPEWTGTFGYRGLFPAEELLRIRPGHQAATNPMVYCGRDKHVVSYPVSGGKLINLVAFVTILGGEGKKYTAPWVTDVPQQEMLDHFVGWEAEVIQLLQCAKTPSRWVIGTVRGLPFSVDGRVALLGDAAHAMPTHHGAGAGQAIEDAFILGRLLANPSVTLTNLPQALQIFQRIRLPFAQDVVERSRASGLVYEFNWPRMGMEPTPAYLKYFSEEVMRHWAWQFEKLPENDWVRANAMLAKVLEAGHSDSHDIPTGANRVNQFSNESPYLGLEKREVNKARMYRL